MNTEEGALHFESSFGNEKFNAAVEEAKKKIQGFSDTSVTAGEKIDDAFKVTSDNIRIQKDVISGLDAQIKAINSEIGKLSPGKAQNELRGQAAQLTAELNAEKEALKQLEQEVKLTDTAHVGLRTRMRQMREALIEMEAAGLRGTTQYEAIRSEFAELTDAMQDAQAQATILGSDERGFKGVISGMSGIAGAASAAQGAVGLFTGENENLQKIMLKVQSLMAITIGLQQIEEMLNKDSAFQLVVVGKAKELLATAELKVATAMGISTVAARALMATLTLGLSAAITGIVILLSRFQSKSAEAKKDLEAFNKAAVDAASKPYVEFKRLQLGWDLLGDNLEAKKKFIDSNAEAFDNLGVKIGSVSDAENLLNSNASTFIESIKTKAKAAAAMEIASEKYKQAIQKMLEAEKMPDKITHTQVSTSFGQSSSDGSYDIENKSKSKLKKEAQGIMEEGDRLIAESLNESKKAAESLVSAGIGIATGAENKAASKLKEIQNAIALANKEGKDRELLELKQQYESDLEAYKDNEEVKKAFAQKYAVDRLNIEKKYLEDLKKENQKAAEALQNLDPGKGYSLMNRTLSNAGVSTPLSSIANSQDRKNLRPSKVEEYTEAEIARRKKIAEQEQERLDNAQRLIGYMGELNNILVDQGVISKETGQVLGTMASTMGNLLSGNYSAAAFNVLQTLIGELSKTFPGVMATESARLQTKITEINRLLEKQEKIIQQSQRSGGERDARQEEINLIQQKIDQYNATIQKYEKIMSQWWRSAKAKDEARFAIIEAQQALEDLQTELADAQQAYNDLLSGGITENDIADAIAQGFEEGKGYVKDFAQYMNSLLRNSLMSIFKEQLINSPYMQQYMEQVRFALSDNVLSEEELNQIQQTGEEFAKSMQPVWDKLFSALPADAASDNNSLTGSIKGITENTASVLAGQMNAIRISQADVNATVREQLLRLTEIAANTKYLISIDSKLDYLKDNSLRSQGLN